MEKQIDARGLQCPFPVIEAKKALKEMKEGSIRILVDNEIAVQNLTKMAMQKQLEVSSEKEGDDFLVSISVISSMEESVTYDNFFEKSQQIPKLSKGLEELFETKTKKTIIVISSDQFGNGDEKLGKTLMKGFLYAVSKQEKLPEVIIFYHQGAKLTTNESENIQDLKEMEAEGVEILTCGTCLDYYGLTEKLAVGSITNMYDIVEYLMSDAKIIRP